MREDSDSDDPSRTGSSDDLEDVFGVLTDRQRRFALYHLKQCGGETELSDLVGQVLEWEHDRPPGQLPERQRQRTYLEFYHSHLPLLEDHDVVEYSDDDGRVRLAGNTDVYEEYLRHASRDDDIGEAIDFR